MAKIFIRERNRVRKGEGVPRFAVVAVEGTDLNFFQLHVRRSELDAIAQWVGAEVVELPRGTGIHAGEDSGGGIRQKRKGQKKKTPGNA
jgi:hypothetical protein